MYRRVLLLCALLIALALPACFSGYATRAAAAAPVTGFAITYLATLPNDSSGKACALNNGGVVVGYSFGGNGVDGSCDSAPVSGPVEYGPPGNTTYHAIFWQDGVANPLANPQGCTSSKAVGINDRGQIVGSCWGAQLGIKPVLWQNGTATILASLPQEPGAAGYARAINNTGTIAGSLTLAYASHAVTWEGGVPRDLGPGDAFAINAVGQIVGYTGSDPSTFAATRWQDGSATMLRSPKGAGLNFARAINAAGRIVGQGAARPEADAILWTDDIPAALPLPAAGGWNTGEAVAYGINDAGLIVGRAYRGGRVSAVLWRDGSPLALEDFVPRSSPALPSIGLLDARAINSTGQIVGTGPGPYLLTPAPVPTFGDVAPGDPAVEAIGQLTVRHIINGCDSAATPPLFCPHDITLRHQMAALIVRAMPGWSSETWTNTFTDPTPDAELWRRVGTLQHYGVVTGYSAASCAAQGKTTPCYGPTDPVLRAQAISFVTRAMVAHGYWTQQPTDPALYGGALVGTGHEQDATTYWYYTRALGGVPDYPEGGGFPVGESAPRDWFARVLWTALQAAGR